VVGLFDPWSIHCTVVKFFYNSSIISSVVKYLTGTRDAAGERRTAPRSATDLRSQPLPVNTQSGQTDAALADQIICRSKHLRAIGQLLCRSPSCLLLPHYVGARALSARQSASLQKPGHSGPAPCGPAQKPGPLAWGRRGKGWVRGLEDDWARKYCVCLPFSPVLRVSLCLSIIFSAL
jgi:hypothetical protein